MAGDSGKLDIPENTCGYPLKRNGGKCAREPGHPGWHGNAKKEALRVKRSAIDVLSSRLDYAIVQAKATGLDTKAIRRAIRHAYRQCPLPERQNEHGSQENSQEGAQKGQQ